MDNEIRLIGRDAEISRDDVEFLFLRVLLLIQRSHFSVAGSTLCINVVSHDNVKYSCVVRDDAVARNYSTERISSFPKRCPRGSLSIKSKSRHRPFTYSYSLCPESRQKRDFPRLSPSQTARALVKNLSRINRGGSDRRDLATKSAACHSDRINLVAMAARGCKVLRAISGHVSFFLPSALFLSLFVSFSSPFGSERRRALISEISDRPR